jgi:hypothetical protein
MRQLWATLTGAGILVAVVVAFIGDEWGTSGIAYGIPLGLLSVAAAMFGRRRPLDLSSEENLALSYRTNFFLSFALVEAPYLIAFVLTFVLGQMSVLFTTLPFFVAGMSLIAPLSRELSRRQQEIMASGSSLSLENALRKAPTRPGVAP